MKILRRVLYKILIDLSFYLMPVGDIFILVDRFGEKAAFKKIKEGWEVNNG